MTRRSQLTGLGDRCGVKIWFPPAGAERVANERTDGLLRYFYTAVRGMDWLRSEEFLAAILRSAYLQGVTDAAHAMAQADALVIPSTSPDEKG